MSTHLSDDQLIDFAYRALTDDARAAMNKHLAACQICRARLANEERLQGRVRESILARRNEFTLASRGNYAAISARVKRPNPLMRWVRRILRPVKGAIELGLAVAVVIAIFVFFAAPNEMPVTTITQPTIGAEGGSPMNPSKCFTLVIFGLTLSVGCAQNTPTPPPAVLTPPPDGVYTKTITKAEEINHGMSEGDACEIAGTNTLTVTGDRWTLNQVPEPGCTVANTSISGSWKFTGDQVAFHEDRYIGCDIDSTYKWSFDGTVLILTQVQDSCPLRIVVNTLRPWVKTTTPTPPAAVMTVPPDGTYQTSENGLGLKLAGGQWTVGFARSIAVGGYIAAGSYQVTGDQITFTEERLSPDATCSRADNIYTYKWAFDATKKTLSFTNVKDNCGDRMGLDRRSVDQTAIKGTGAQLSTSLCRGREPRHFCRRQAARSTHSRIYGWSFLLVWSCSGWVDTSPPEFHLICCPESDIPKTIAKKKTRAIEVPVARVISTFFPYQCGIVRTHPWISFIKGICKARLPFIFSVIRKDWII